MADIQLHCLGCNKAFLVSEDQAGLLVSCPQCGRQIAVPVPATPAELTPKLSVRKDIAVGGGTLCPSCSATMPPGAIICVHCGYDTRKGRRIGEAVGWPPYARWLIAGVGVIVLALGIRFYLTKSSPLTEIVSPPPPRPVTPPLEVREPPPAPPEPDEPTPVAPVPSSTVTTAQTPAPEGPLEEEMAQLEEDYRVSLKMRLDQQQPLYRPGEAVELRMANGLILRGKIHALTPEKAVVLREEGEATVALTNLDHKSRLRCDPAYREKFIEFLVRKNAGVLRSSPGP